MPICPSCHSIYEMKEDHCPKCGEPKPARYVTVEEPQEAQAATGPKRWSVYPSDNWRCGMFYIVCMYFFLVYVGLGVLAIFLASLSIMFKGRVIEGLAALVLGVPIAIGAFMVVLIAIKFANNE